MLLRTESGFLISSSILLACIIAPASSSGRFGTAFATPLSNAPPGIAWVHDGRALARGPGPMGTGRIVRGGTGGPQVGISTASSCARAGGADHGNAEILLRGLSSLGLGKGLSLPNVVANAAEVISLGAKVERFIAKQDFSVRIGPFPFVCHIESKARHLSCFVLTLTSDWNNPTPAVSLCTRPDCSARPGCISNAVRR